jgi:hypothetical protein
MVSRISYALDKINCYAVCSHLSKLRHRFGAFDLHADAFATCEVLPYVAFVNGLFWTWSLRGGLGSGWKCFSDVQFVLRREAQSGKVWFRARGILPNKTLATTVERVLLLESRNRLTIFSDDLHLVRSEVVPIRLTDGKKQQVSVFSAFCLSPAREISGATLTENFTHFRCPGLP